MALVAIKKKDRNCDILNSYLTLRLLYIPCHLYAKLSEIKVQYTHYSASYLRRSRQIKAHSMLFLLLLLLLEPMLVSLVLWRCVQKLPNLFGTEVTFRKACSRVARFLSMFS